MLTEWWLAWPPCVCCVQVMVQNERSGRQERTVDPQLLKMALASHPKLRAALFPSGPRGNSPSSDISVYHLLQVNSHLSHTDFTETSWCPGSEPDLQSHCFPSWGDVSKRHSSILLLFAEQNNISWTEVVSCCACHSRLGHFEYVLVCFPRHFILWTPPGCLAGRWQTLSTQLVRAKNHNQNYYKGDFVTFFQLRIFEIV